MKKKIMASVLLIILLNFLVGCNALKSREDLLKENLEKNCNNFISYQMDISKRDGVVEDIGLCDDKFVKVGVYRDGLYSPNNSFKMVDYIFNNDTIINNIFVNSLYYYQYDEKSNNYDINIILNGNSCNSFDYYRSDIIKMIRELQKEYNLKSVQGDYKNIILVRIYLAIDTNFNNNYYKAALVSSQAFDPNVDKVDFVNDLLTFSVNNSDDESIVNEKFIEARDRLIEYGCKDR